MVLGWWLRCNKSISINWILHTKISPFPCMQGGTCGTENCDGRGLMYSAWPIRVGWVAGSGWMPIWLTNADQLRSAHAEPGSQSNQPQSARVTCGASVKSLFWIWSLRPGCSKVSWDLWNRTIEKKGFSMQSVLTHLLAVKIVFKLLDCGRTIQNDVHRYIICIYCKPELISWWWISITVFNMGFLSSTDQKSANSSTYWQILYYRPTSKFRYTMGEILKNMKPRSRYVSIYIYRYNPHDNQYGFSYIDRQH